MARAKREIDKDEIEEIILLKLEELGGRKSKLTANNVAKFSKEIANNEKYKRKNGKLFNYYGYDIWAGRYKGQDYYGKIKLAEIKNSIDVVAVGKEFIPDIQDIIILVDKNYKEPEKLSKKLISIFESDKKRIDKLSKELDKVKEQNKRLKQNLQDFQEGFLNMFFNSNQTDNSLTDILTVPRAKDGYISQELQDMFKDEYDLMIGEAMKLVNISNSNNKVISVAKNNSAIEEKRRNRRLGL